MQETVINSTASTSMDRISNAVSRDARCCEDRLCFSREGD